MIDSFSERQGIIKSESLNLNEMPIELRNRLWNIIQRYINDLRDRNGILEYWWDRFFKQDVSTLKYQTSFITSPSEYSIEQIKEKFYELEWNKDYDFLELLLCADVYSEKNSFINKLNSVFLEERTQYQIISGMVTPLISGEEAKEVEKATESKYSAVSKHIKKGIELYHKRPAADYQNSIKESISAIEALAKIVLKESTAILGAVASQLNIHPAFQEAIKKLYGWTSDEGGIRHAENGKELKIDEKEARYMLVQCSALVNYIISKYEN